MKREDYNSFFEEVIVGIIKDIEQLSEQLMGDQNVLKRKKEKNIKSRSTGIIKKSGIMSEAII